MDTASGPLVQIPATLGHEQLSSPLTYDSQFPVPHRLDMNAVANANRRRRPSKSGPSSAGVKRSASSPNMRSLSASSDSAAISAEKRRNKLGYHRTSVACVHCRRRKIRCLLAPDDPQNRCSNCIRLKKECNFFPVDQQPPHERRPRTGSKMETLPGDVSASSSSSPNVAVNRSGDPNDLLGHYQQMSHPPHGFPMVPMATSTTMSPPGSAAAHNLRFDAQDQPQGGGWDPRFFENQQIPANHAIHDEASQTYWRTPDTPMTPGFSPYSSAPPSSVMGPGGGYPHFGPVPPRPEGEWHPGRSMSYSQIDEASHHRQDSHGSGYPTDLRRSTVDMLPPSLHSSSTSTATSMSDLPSNAPPSTTAGQPVMQQYALPSTGWNMLPTTSPKHTEFGSWYAEPTQLAKVQEEDLSHFGNQLPSGHYAAGGSR